MFPHCSIYKCTWTSPNDKIHSQIDHVWTDKRWNANVDDV